MDRKDDPEARIRELERSLDDMAGKSELGAAKRGFYGNYPPSTPAAGYGASFPPPPRRTGGTRVGLIVLAVVVAVMALGVAGVIVFVTQVSNVVSGGGSTTSAASTRPSSASTRPSSASTRPSRSTTPASPNLQRLYGVLPQGYDSNNCSEVTTPNRQALTTVECGQTSDTSSPKFAAFTLYPDATALAKAFQDAVDEDTVTPCPDGASSPSTWDSDSAPGVAAGSILCGNYKNEADLVWTRTSDLLLGDVQGPDIKALYQFWQYHLD